MARRYKPSGPGHPRPRNPPVTSQKAVFTQLPYLFKNLARIII